MISALLVAAAFALPELRPSIHWADVTDAPLHGRHLSNEVGDAYVRRAPSDTVRLVALHLSHPELKRRHLEDNENFEFDGAALGIVLSLDYNRREELERFEFPVLIVFATVGMMLMISAKSSVNTSPPR
jgi:hypothetical protein